MPFITRELAFDAGHRLINHESKCANLHGHRYVAQITVYGQELDKLGRVIDFSVIKDIVGGWIDAYWDHNVIFHVDDPLLKKLVIKDFGNKSPFIMVCNPTAENMAQLLLEEAGSLLEPKGLIVSQVRLYETPNCWADAYT